MHAFVVLDLVFSIPSQEIGLGNVSEMTYFVFEWDGTQNLSQSLTFLFVLLCGRSNWLSIGFLYRII